MDDYQRRENLAGLSKIAASVMFPYIWLGLFLILSLMYQANFFGQGFGGGLVAVLLCIGFLNPLVPGAISNYVVRPIFVNLLTKETISSSGCITGLVGVVVMGLGILFFLARDLNTSLIFFFLTPVVGGVLAVVATLLGRGGGGASRSSAPTIVKRDPPQLTDSGSRSRLPEGRRAERPSLSSGSSSQPRIAPPPRRDNSRRDDGKRPPPPPRRR